MLNLLFCTLVVLLQGCTKEFNENNDPQSLVGNDSGVQNRRSGQAEPLYEI